jgi:hypothetical protein
MNADLLFYIWIPWDGLVTVFILHVAFSRSGSMDFLRALASAAGLGTLCVFFLQVLMTVVMRPLNSADALAWGAVNLVIYVALLYIYVNFVNMGETARRIRILRELVDVPEGLSREELLHRYNAREIVAQRLKRLAVTGQIISVGDGRWRARSGSIMLLTARFVQAMKVFFLGASQRRP